MKIFLAFFACLSLNSLSVQASEEWGIASRVMSCTTDSDSIDQVYVYFDAKDLERTSQESGANIFEKLMKKENGVFKVRFNFTWHKETREIIADVKYSYDANAKKLNVNVGEAAKFDLNYSLENKAIRLKDTTGNAIDILCVEDKK